MEYQISGAIYELFFAKGSIDFKIDLFTWGGCLPVYCIDNRIWEKIWSLFDTGRAELAGDRGREAD